MSGICRSSESISPPFKVPDEYASILIESIKVYDGPAQNLALKIVDAYHCFCIITLKDGTEHALEAGGNQKHKMAVSYGPIKNRHVKDRHFITKADFSTKSITFNELGNYIKSQYFNSNYDVIGNNCYDVAVNILRHFNFKQKATKVQKRGDYHIVNGTGTFQKYLLGTAILVTSLFTKNPNLSLATNLVTGNADRERS